LSSESLCNYGKQYQSKKENRFESGTKETENPKVHLLNNRLDHHCFMDFDADSEDIKKKPQDCNL